MTFLSSVAGRTHLLTSAERTAVDLFVQSGGGLLLPYDERTAAVYNPIANKYGIEFIDEAGLNDPTDGEDGEQCPCAARVQHTPTLLQGRLGPILLGTLFEPCERAGRQRAFN